jgi:hypothetical protein
VLTCARRPINERSIAKFKQRYLLTLLSPIPLYLLFLLCTQGSISVLSKLSAEASLSLTLALVVLFAAHELIHVGVFWSGGVDCRHISLAMDRYSFALGIDLSVPIPVKLWRISLLAPLAVLSAMLTVIGLQEGAHSAAWLLLAFSTSGCAYDVAVFMSLRGYPSDRQVCPGFVIEEERLALQA